MSTAPTDEQTSPAVAVVPVGASFGLLEGPWRSGMYFGCGPAASKSNHRQSARSRAKGSWSRVAGFESDVAIAAREARPLGWPLDAPGPVATRPVVVTAIWAATTLDASNLSKSVLDALEGVLYRTDVQVRAEQSVTERRAADQRTAVAVVVLDAGATGDQVFAASTALAGILTDVVAVTDLAAAG